MIFWYPAPYLSSIFVICFTEHHDEVANGHVILPIDLGEAHIGVGDELAEGDDARHFQNVAWQWFEV